MCKNVTLSKDMFTLIIIANFEIKEKSWTMMNESATVGNFTQNGHH